MTRRGKVFAIVGAIVAVVLVAVAVMAITGNGPKAVTDAINDVVPGGSPDTPPPVCPLTDMPAPGGKIPQRPMLAVKVENLPEARPQYGLDTADIIYEEPVEGGITRFIVMYQCDDAPRIEPVRSARTTDPEILVQYGTPAFGYADAAGYVQNAVKKVKAIDDVSISNAPSAYHRDSGRAEPHNLYSSTKELYKAAKKGLQPPEPVFQYGDSFDVKSRPAKDVELYFSDYSDVHWKWSGGRGVWERFHGTAKHVVAEGGQVEATNVVIQLVEVENTKHLDPAGNPVPAVKLTGGGKAYLLRDGRLYAGKWERKSDKELTVFSTKGGDEFVLAPGKTWVELYPTDRPKVKP